MIDAMGTASIMTSETKAASLLEERAIVPFVTEVCRLRAFSSIERRLLAIQREVYELDLLGESTWRIDKRDLDAAWIPIYRRTQEAFGLDHDSIEQLFVPMKRYQDVELCLRRGISPLVRPIGLHYRLKKCDVQIQRELLMAYAGVRVDENVWRLWSSFDVVTEMVDDLADVAEDGFSFNCNRVMSSVRQVGATQTVKDYEQLLRHVVPMNGSRRVGCASGALRGIEELCERAAMHVRELLADVRLHEADVATAELA